MRTCIMFSSASYSFAHRSLSGSHSHNFGQLRRGLIKNAPESSIKKSESHGRFGDNPRVLGRCSSSFRPMTRSEATYAIASQTVPS